MKQGNVYKWSFIDRISLALINFGVNIVLARMLTTADYGLLAMIAIFVAVASDLSSCGLSDGLVHKLRPTERDYSTVFVFNAGFGLLFGSLFFFTAPLTAEFFGHDELIGIMRVLGVCFFFQTMSYVQETRLRKQLRMKAICIVRVSATVTVSVMAILAAVNGYGYKALICTQLLLSFFLFLYYNIASRWFPKIDFSVKSFKEFFSYGVHLMLAYLASVIGRNINTFVLGRFYPSPSASGIYYQGAKLAAVPFGVTESSLNSPFFVVASNEEDEATRRTLIMNMMRTIIGVNGILMMFLCVIAGPCIELLYGDEWIGAVPIFRILAVAEFLICTRAFFQTICKVHARTVFVRNMGFAEVALQLLFLLIFYRFGILWIAWTQVLGVAFAAAVYVFYCRKMLQISCLGLLSFFIRTLSLPAVSCMAALIAALCVQGAAPFVQCAAISVVFAVVFVVAGELSKADLYMSVRKLVLKK